MDYGKWVVRKQVVDQQKTNDFEIIDHPSKLTHRGSRPGPGLVFRWSQMDWGNRQRNNPMKTKSDLNFIVYRFNIELVRTESVVSLVKGRLICASNF